MATATPKPFSCRFISIMIAIDDARYSVDPIDPGEMGTQAFRLTKHAADRGTYDVIRNHYGLIDCTCADFEFRRKGNTSEPCRHGRALTELGLLAGPTPALVSESRWTASQAPRLLDAIRAAAADEPTAPPAGEWTCQKGDCGGCQASAHHDPEFTPPCCAADEASPCVGCVGAAPVADAATAILERGLVLAAAEVINQPVALDDFDDEPPALDYNPSEEDEQAFIAWKRESAARDHLDDPTLSLAELVERQVEFYERWDNPAGRMLAATMSELLMKVKLTNATTPGELDGRVAALEADVRESWEAAGYESGRLAGCRCGEVVLN